MENLKEIRELCDKLKAAIDEFAPSRETSLAKTKVDEAMLWTREAARTQGGMITA